MYDVQETLTTHDMHNTQGVQMEVITIAIQKGGTGKTTTACILSQAAVYQRKKILAIDLDPQGNLSFSLGASSFKNNNSFDLIVGNKVCPQKTPQNIDIIPSSWNLSTLTSHHGSALRLQKSLERFKNNYDLIIIDTPPTAGELQYNALQASTELIIPMHADIYNLQSLYQIIDTTNQVKKSNPNLSVLGFILTEYDNRITISRQMKQTISEKADPIPLLGIIHKSISVQESSALQKSIFDYAPNSKPATDYLSLFDSIIRRTHV